MDISVCSTTLFRAQRKMFLRHNSAYIVLIKKIYTPPFMLRTRPQPKHTTKYLNLNIYNKIRISIQMNLDFVACQFITLLRYLRIHP